MQFRRARREKEGGREIEKQAREDKANGGVSGRAQWEDLLKEAIPNSCWRLPVPSPLLASPQGSVGRTTRGGHNKRLLQFVH